MHLSATQQCHVPGSRLSLHRGCTLAPFRRQQPRRIAQQRCVVKAGLDSQALLAVTQQGLIFAAVVGGETYLSQQALRPGAPGRPELVPSTISVGAIVAEVALVQVGGIVTQAGLAAGATTTLVMLVNYGKRFAQTEDDPNDWPGPKVWPFTMVLLDFFCVNIFGQALLRTF